MATRSSLLSWVALGLVTCAPAPRASVGTEEPSRAAGPAPACPEVAPRPGAWPRASGVARAVPGEGRAGHIAQGLDGREPVRLRFLGAHSFDLLDKLEHEAGPTELDRRRVICAALNAVAEAGAPVVRLWGSLKRTGTRAEVERAASLLALVLDEDARRARPLRLWVTLQNHQSGYGAPNPEASLDDQDPKSAWSAKRLYLEEGWRARGEGQLLERVERFRADRTIAASPYVLAWELVNELDTHRSIAGGSMQGPEAEALRDRFLVPALALLAESFPQPIVLGDLRGAEASYTAFARGVIERLPAAARARLVWTSHVYAPETASAEELRLATTKLDLDLAIAAAHGLPFVLGELGQRTRGATRFCGEGPPHDPAGLFAAVLDAPPHADIDAVVFWGEGRCGLPIPGSTRRITIGAGGDSADLSPGDAAAHAALRALRAHPRFRSGEW